MPRKNCKQKGGEYEGWGFGQGQIPVRDTRTPLQKAQDRLKDTEKVLEQLHTIRIPGTEEELNEYKNIRDNELNKYLANKEDIHTEYEKQNEQKNHEDLRKKIIGYFQYAMGKYHNKPKLVEYSVVNMFDLLAEAYKEETKNDLQTLSDDIYKTYKNYSSPKLHRIISENHVLQNDIEDFVIKSGIPLMTLTDEQRKEEEKLTEKQKMENKMKRETEANKIIVETILKDYSHLKGIKKLQSQKYTIKPFDTENAKKILNNIIKEIEEELLNLRSQEHAKEIEERIEKAKEGVAKEEAAAAAEKPQAEAPKAAAEKASEEPKPASLQQGGKKGRKTRKNSNRKTKKSGKKSGKKSRKLRRK
jgi:hypothetical protein